VLKASGLVDDRAEGNRRIYHLEPEGLQRLRDHLDWYWERSLTAYQRAAEATAKERGMTEDQEIVVAKSALVHAPLAVAFEVFVGQEWWPVETHHLAEPPGRDVILEPFAGGRWYERAADGTEAAWGTVLAWQPPYRLLLSWQVSAQWKYEEDPGRGSEIEVTFTPQGPHETRVDYTHRHLERYGPQAERMRRILDGKGGEPLNAFARHITTRTETR
jgi:hypothetical protein